MPAARFPSPLPRWRTALLSLGLLAALPAGASPPQLVSVQSIGPGVVTDVSADGRAAVGQLNNTFTTFRWTPEAGRVSLGRGTFRPLRGQVSGTPKVSADGQTVASTIIDATGRYYTQGLWTPTGGWRQIDDRMPADAGILDRGNGSVFGLSRDGQVVTGLYWRPGQSGGLAHGSVWRDSTGTLGLATEGGSSRVDDASTDGSTLVGWEEDASTGSRQPAVWVNGQRTVLGAIGEAASVNGAGTRIVGQLWNDAAQQNQAALWTWDGSAWQTRYLGVLPGTKAVGTAYATGASDDGRLVVGFNRKNFLSPETQAFLWTEATGMVELMAYLARQGTPLPTTVTLDFIAAVNPAGTVLAAQGSDTRFPGVRRSYLLRLAR